jgi:hypothetical protein
MLPALLVVAALLSSAPSRADDFTDQVQAGIQQGPHWTDKARAIQKQQDALRNGQVTGPAATTDGCTVFGPDMDVTKPVPTLGVAARIKGRDFPSVVQPWHGADNLDPAPFSSPTPLPDAPKAGAGLNPANVARHDLAFFGPGAIGLKPVNSCQGLAVGYTAASVGPALAKRAEILSANPHAVLLAEIRWHDGRADYLPAASPWWKTGDAHQDMNDGAYRLLDVANPGFRAQVARQCKAAILTGVFDGCMFDWWIETPDVIALAHDVRTAIGPEALIVVNANNRQAPGSAADINGLYMEGFGSSFWPANPSGWAQAQANIEWAEHSLHAPAFAALEGWAASSRSDFRDIQTMRALTALALTHSNAFVLFGDKNTDGANDHRHDWYPFWDKGLGGPPKDAQPVDGATQREYPGGIVVYNPAANHPVTINFTEARYSRASHKTAKTHTVAPGDGDIFTKASP